MRIVDITSSIECQIEFSFCFPQNLPYVNGFLVDMCATLRLQRFDGARYCSESENIKYYIYVKVTLV